MDFDLTDSSVTEALGAALAHSLPGAVQTGAVQTGAVPRRAVQRDVMQTGAVVYLQGELGAGKTSCARSLFRALGVAGLVRSPTYTLVETYAIAALTCFHADLYRLQTLAEVDELGLLDLVGPGCLLLVEWPERGAGALPPADLILNLSYAGDARRASLRGATPLGSEWLLNLGDDTSLSRYLSNLT